MFRYGWVVVLDDRNIVTKLKNVTFVDEVAQDDRLCGPHVHHEGAEICAFTEHVMCPKLQF